MKLNHDLKRNKITTDIITTKRKSELQSKYFIGYVTDLVGPNIWFPNQFYKITSNRILEQKRRSSSCATNRKERKRENKFKKNKLIITNNRALLFMAVCNIINAHKLLYSLSLV